ncbi:hypothetical protein MLD38_025647 [Melastoma candidum]|uniref:Uncharacterized protein n=1 Tax=Melastoma candidum TaxID=119954 RepID=A0ACB9P167_9MYRT|nr:hypothetical protein MLD38_025647 [Melastoma candidum]
MATAPSLRPEIGPCHCLHREGAAPIEEVRSLLHVFIEIFLCEFRERDLISLTRRTEETTSHPTLAELHRFLLMMEFGCNLLRMVQQP